MCDVPCDMACDVSCYEITIGVEQQRRLIAGKDQTIKKNGYTLFPEPLIAVPLAWHRACLRFADSVF